ncbi:MAG: NUDIX domain-containing protein [Patescibacteria group bacterium]
MKQKTIGVAVGRFETPYLHSGHSYLLNAVQRCHDTLCVVLGTHGGNPTDRYPLDIDTRTKMIHSSFPSAVVLSIADLPSDQKWSENLDSLLKNTFINDAITVYGSRQSFLDCYSGELPVMVIDPIKSSSATEIRSKECFEAIDTVDFRKGIIYSHMKRFPIVYSTVDVVPYRKTEAGIELLIGKKITDNGKHRIIGGFVDTVDLSHTDAALRELAEEIPSITVGTPEYVGSKKINDYRYNGSRDSVLTTLFVVPFIDGVPTPGDDIDEVLWVHIDQALTGIASFHTEIAELAISYIKNKFLNN